MCEVGPGQRSLVPRKRRPSSETPKGKTLKIALPEPRAKGRKREKNNRESKSGGEEKEFSFLDDGLKQRLHLVGRGNWGVGRAAGGNGVERGFILFSRRFCWLSCFASGFFVSEQHNKGTTRTGREGGHSERIYFFRWTALKLQNFLQKRIIRRRGSWFLKDGITSCLGRQNRRNFRWSRSHFPRLP